MKRTAVAALALMLPLSLGTLAGTFAKTKTYTDGMFSDVAADA